MTLHKPWIAHKSILQSPESNNTIKMGVSLIIDILITLNSYTFWSKYFVSDSKYII